MTSWNSCSRMTTIHTAACCFIPGRCEARRTPSCYFNNMTSKSWNHLRHVMIYGTFAHEMKRFRRSGNRTSLSRESSICGTSRKENTSLERTNRCSADARSPSSRPMRRAYFIFSFIFYLQSCPVYVVSRSRLVYKYKRMNAHLDVLL